MSELIKVEAPGARGAFQRWLDRGDAVGVFTNQDLGHPELGHMLFIPLDPGEQLKLEPGKAHAPDGRHGLGWRYLLTSVERSLDAFAFSG